MSNLRKETKSQNKRSIPQKSIEKANKLELSTTNIQTKNNINNFMSICVISVIVVINTFKLQQTTMKKIMSLFFFTLVLVSAQQYLPKDQLPWNILLANNIANSGTSEFWKVDQDGPSIIISAYPVRPNSITKVTFYLVNGNSFIIGCGKGGELWTLSRTDVGYRGNTVGYRVPVGTKIINGDDVAYASPAYAGDTVSMTIDLRPFKNTVSFTKNGLDMGIAFMGLNYWGSEIYIMVDLWGKGGRIKVTKYEVIA